MGIFLNLICDIGLCDMQNAENKQQRHATLPFLKIDIQQWGPSIKFPIRLDACYSYPCNKTLSLSLTSYRPLQTHPDINWSGLENNSGGYPHRRGRHTKGKGLNCICTCICINSKMVIGGNEKCIPLCPVIKLRC